MIYFPKPERNKEYVNTVAKYDKNLLQTVMYSYLNYGMSHREIENLVIEYKGLGYESMKILHYYGIKPKHKGIFRGLIELDVIESLQNSEHDVDEIIELLIGYSSNQRFKDIESILDNDVNKLREVLGDNVKGDMTASEIEAYYNSEMKVRNMSLQRQFRKDLQKEFNNQCALCNISGDGLLVASHILPYAKCGGDINKAGNSNNGLLLCVLHDALFESGKYITFKDDGQIEISYGLPEEMYNEVKITDNTVIKPVHLNEERKYFLSLHRLMFNNRKEK